MRILLFAFLIMTVKSVSFGQILVNVHLNTMETVSIDFYGIDSIRFQLETPPETITYHTQDSTYHFELAQIDSITYASEWDLVGHLNSTLTYGEVIDIDGNVYPTIVIGNQKWMAENLRVSTYSNGDPIDNIVDASTWQDATYGAWTHLSLDPSLDMPYGKLYNLYAVVDSRNICPEGWRVPYELDFAEMLNYLNLTPPGFGLRSMSQVHSFGPFFGDNQSGFSAVKSGFMTSGSSDFGGYLEYLRMYFWTAGMVHNQQGFFFKVTDNDNVDFETAWTSSYLGMNVRCIENELTYGSVTDVEGNEYRTVFHEGQEWMAENLKVTKFNNLDDIPLLVEDSEWHNATFAAYCEVDNDPLLTDLYGLHYNHYVVSDNRNVCPTGWHVPSYDELSHWWIGLLQGIRLVKPNTGLWMHEGIGAKGDYGFDALPAGCRNPMEILDPTGWAASFWTTDDASNFPEFGNDPERFVHLLFVNYEFSLVEMSMIASDAYQGSSIRCVRD